METIITAGLLLCMIGVIFYIAGKSLSKNIKSLGITIGKNGCIEIHNEFYKEQ